MEVKAIGRYIRMGPHKVRRVIDLVRGKDLDFALKVLEFTPTKASGLIKKIVLSAAANAENNYNLERSQLFISKAYVDRGPFLKRLNPRARRRADIIRRRTSHITVVLDEKRR